MSVLQVVDINLILAFHPLYLTRRNCTLRWVEYTCEVQKKYIANCVYLKKNGKKNRFGTLPSVFITVIHLNLVRAVILK